MPSPPATLHVFVLFVLFLFSRGPLLAACAGLPSTYLTVERTFPLNSGLEKLKAHDQARHGRLLQAIPGVVDFPVEGSSNPFSVGLYFTRVKLGNPPKEFYVQIDTGSDILWVTCNPCNGCPTSSGLNIQLESFDPVASPTSSLISCGDQICSSFLQTSDAICASSATQRNLCGYAFQYGDGSGTSGYYVSDTMHFESIISNEQIFNSSANIIFGPHYNLNLRSIAVNGQILPIDSSVFSTSNTQGTIIDSGTTLAYLAEEAYDPFVNAITASVLQVVQPRVIRGNQCFVTLSRVGEIFPFVTLIFEGNAQMVLKPEDYLLQQGSVGDAVIWCIGWQKSQGQGVTILGDIVLKDKIFVYDLVRQRLGWTNYDCSLPVNVSSSSSKNDVINAGQLSMSGCSSLRAFFNIMTVGCALVFYIWSCNKHDI